MTNTLKGFEAVVADAIIGVDTLWGGDVNNPSGLGRFIADCYFSGRALPACYEHPTAALLREKGGVGADGVPNEDVRAFIEEFALERRIAQLCTESKRLGGLRGRYLEGLSDSLLVMLDLARETLGDGPEVPYERAVMASCGEAPRYIDATTERARVRDLLSRVGEPVEKHGGDLSAAVDAWRSQQAISRKDLENVSEAIIPKLDELTARYVMPHLPPELQKVPRANIKFLPIENAWFSGSMNYLGRKRLPDGTPEYEATYEINASLEISGPEFEHLVSHEVVPGHVTTFAFLQHLYHIGEMGFEATIQTMNTRGATLSEGIANNAILFALGVRSVEEIPDDELRLGVTLSLLQDVAKSNASYLLYADKLTPDAVARRIRTECLISEERADKLARSWGGHPILGRMYLPCYAVGTRVVAQMLRDHGPANTIPAVFGARGPVDVVTVLDVVRQG